jgi:hypothetical protein
LHGLQNQGQFYRPKDTNTPIKHESHIIIQKADDSTTDKARKNLVNKLNQQHGKENVVVIKEIENVFGVPLSSRTSPSWNTTFA